MNWTFTPDQFSYAWESTGLDWHPYPLSVWPTAQTEDERAQHLRELKPWAERAVTADLEVAFRILAQPDLRITVFGLEGPDESRPIRVLAASEGRTGVVAAQQEGRHGKVWVSLGQLNTLLLRTVASIPPEPAGREPARTERLSEVQRDGRDVIVSSVTTKSGAAQIRQLAAKPRRRTGNVLVATRLSEGIERPDRILSWIDVEGDGRYVIRAREEVDVIPATREVFVEQIRRLIREE